ncbi:PhzF family phenazine biosynthesis protein [Rhizobium sp. SL86]|uniref:PhzF family phenazine biosynthesis protein n=1 Tax=Rhizobium sp. SL86 TaxID=2995148 RepID=UPI002273E0F6|nr:PhzF family phenazine biosynthesis protein [Rhizobium sp. SL86]MCY1666193.1 PhzF family phenazine biosynthesis protein [Rhizobium sp. SL86]
MRKAAFVTVDVFTGERFTGNPLAVILDARGMSDEDMQNVAAEFGYSESTFILPPDDPAHHARVRIFTPVTEVPFAGHPNVGTAYVIGQRSEIFGKPVADRLVFEEKAGLVEVTLQRQDGRVTAAAIRAPKALEVGSTVPVEVVATCLSLEPSQIRTASHLPCMASVGLAFVMVELVDLAALAAARTDRSLFEKARESHATPENDFPVFLYVRDPSHPFRLRARMFAPLDNVPEDPATGSASGALAALLASLDPRADGLFEVMIEQGVEMGRRSIIRVTVEKRDGKPGSVVISGESAAVMEGQIAF